MTSQLALYVSQGPDLVHYSIDLDDATLSRHETVSAPQVIQYAWVHPTNRFIYAASSIGMDGKEHHLTAFRIGPDGKLSQNGEPVRLAHRPIHLTIDATGRYLLTGYNKPSTATVHHIESGGRIGQIIEQPKSIDAGNYLHQIRLLPSNRGAVIVARGTHRPGLPTDPGSLKLLKFHDGILTNVDTVAPNHEFGPRHLDFHPAKPWVYVSLEHENELQVFESQNDRFSHDSLFSRSLLAEPNNVRPRQLGGAIHVHPNGRYVYVANRADYRIEREGTKVFGGGENSIAVFEIDQYTGEATRIQLADPQSFYIRCFAMDPSGTILVTVSLIDMNVLEDDAVRHVSRTITIFQVGSDGTLTLRRKYDVDTAGKNQWWMKIVKPPE
jgi:6-phosphogluconolactonase (cycloisomerase 2 family)